MRYATKITPALLRAIISAETPRGWTVHFVRHTGGVAMLRKRELHIPALRRGYRCLNVFFHEVGHALRYIEGKFAANRNEMSSSHEEWIAETFAFEMLTRYGFPITQTAASNARSNVRQWVRREQRAGLPIYTPVAQFVRPTRRAT